MHDAICIIFACAIYNVRVPHVTLTTCNMCMLVASAPTHSPCPLNRPSPYRSKTDQQESVLLSMWACWVLQMAWLVFLAVTTWCCCGLLVHGQSQGGEGEGHQQGKKSSSQRDNLGTPSVCRVWDLSSWDKLEGDWSMAVSPVQLTDRTSQLHGVGWSS